MNTALSWYEQTAAQALEALHATDKGLSSDQARERLLSCGPNSLPQAPKRHTLLAFLRQFHNILIYVLIGSALITATLGHWVDTCVILAVVVANAVIGFVQEGKAEKSMEAVRQMLSPQASVLRDGLRIRVPAEYLVPGDVVLLEAGDRVPADVRLLTAHGLSVQEAILTGESVPVEKNIQPVAQTAALGDRICMAYSGTLVSSGQGRGVVVGTGARTEIGHISGLLSEVQTLTTPLVKQMGTFAQWLTISILLLAMLLLIYGYFIGRHDFSELFMAVVGLSVAAIPEGLPAVLSITLAIGVQAMARRNAIVRRLPAIETLGSVSVICTDKTGTLTRNEMMVASVLTHQHLFTLGGQGYEPRGNLHLDEMAVNPEDHSVLAELARVAALCNDAALHQRGAEWQVEGDPMEGALLAYAGKILPDLELEQRIWTRTDAIPFDARYRYMATLHHNHERRALACVKGAPEQILAMCANQRSQADGVEALDVQYWHALADRVAAQGQRVLAFASRSLDSGHTVLEHGDVKGTLTLLGMMGMIDPPRQEVLTAVDECHGAGIHIKMITGDHVATAKAIARQIGLHHPDDALTGIELDQLDDAALRQRVLDCNVYARTSPEHKLRLVMALQSHGLIVAMTGDGVNDAPALKRADVGIAMGKKGSEVAKESAELVLADDNFATIVAAVREGRTVYDNIKKVISWTLPTNAGEAMTIVAALLLGLTLPITPIQILWVNLITAITLGIALAFEPTEEGTMLRPPRARSEPLLSGMLVWHIVLVAILFLCGVYGIFTYAIDRGYSVELARTLAVNTLVVMEIFHLFFIRNFYSTSLNWKAVRGTRVVWAVVAVITAAQFAITYLPVLQSVFATEPVPFLDGLLVIAIGVSLFIIIEVEKYVRLRVVN